MNSVFSAFKASKNEKSKPLAGNKKSSSMSQESSYENLRHIREIGSSSKMMTSIVNDDVEENMLNNRTHPLMISKLVSMGDGASTKDAGTSDKFSDANKTAPTRKSTIDEKTAQLGSLAATQSLVIIGDMSPTSMDSGTTTLQRTTYHDLNERNNEIVRSTTPSPTTRCGSSCSSMKKTSGPVDLHSKLESNENETVERGPSPLTSPRPDHVRPIIVNNNGSAHSKEDIQPTSAGSSSAATTPKTTRHAKLRLSISNFTNNSLPSIHGRSAQLNTTPGGKQKQRLSTHQRNLSLDFRSMGILLPPISQVTNTRINLTQHHRNRSLDSALQRIPEVEVSSPNAESENTFCTNSILGSTMCSKIVSSTSTNPQNTPKASLNVNLKVLDSDECAKPMKNIEAEKTGSSEKNPDNKKREDLTSLGSDDSGIICGSESDQLSLNRIRQSHESLDSGEIDPEEECIEILETTSMDEEYKMLQSDLCFYQTPGYKKARRDIVGDSGRSVENVNRSSYTLNSKLDDSIISGNNVIGDNNHVGNETNADCETPVINQNEDDCDITPTPNDDKMKQFDMHAKTQQAKSEVEGNKLEHVKNEILFKSFFGATKNAIFRTAQSIIDSHEKKNASKNKTEEIEVKSPTEVSRKKEFFVLKSCSNKSNKTATTPEPSPPEEDIKQITKSASATSLNKLKVPGVVKCFVKEKDQSSIGKTEKGPSGLLRFFESPVFNIHFAIHYLFYSKEPGVLSFIGNKIFSFPDQDVDLYIPQLIVMYIQMDELAEVLDPYLTFRCRKSVDFSLKCLWLLEAYDYQIEINSALSNSKPTLSLMKELYSKKERKQLKTCEIEVLSPIRKTHHRSQSDATVLLSDSHRFPSSGSLTLKSKVQTPTSAKLCLGDLTSGRAFESGCTCFESVRGTVNGLLGQKTVCCCGAPKLAPQKEFMKALINIGKNLTSLQTKAEKTSALRMFLNLINKNLPARVWLPLHSDIPHHIVRITEEKTAVLNSKDKTPYIIYVEVVEVNDIYSSPVIMKMMPSLRHTKSEENLESKENNVPSATNSATNLSSKDCPIECEKSSNNINNNSNTSCNVKESKTPDCGNDIGNKGDMNELHLTEDDVWSQEDDEITAQYMNLHRMCERDAISQMSLDSCDSRDQSVPALFNIGDVRTRHCKNLTCENMKPFSNDPEDPSAAALKEPWHEKEKQIRESSPYGHLSNWRLLSAIVKCGDDLRQELMATQLLQMFKIIWQEESVDLWVRPYKIVCLSNDSGLIEPIPNTVSVHQIKKNSNKSLRDYFIGEYGDTDSEKFKSAQRNFVQSCAAYCLISYLLQVKDRHNGNILLHSDGHIIHIDFGFILNISPKNLGFEQSPFKLTAEFVEVMDGTESGLWIEFNHLLLKGLMAARKHMDRIINLVEIMRSNAQLPCFKNSCSGTVQNLRKRFHMNLTEQELERKVEQLVQDSLKSLSTKLYDGYQYFTNGIL
ncbi:uncharacterized protein LOC119650198 [Hermetia illucens]|uniref:uncharacterized protein LOC119650198 n=1 Tax=Hermetia illucens TaxID=343691 RepID=UPI0018CC49F6|nr:uncharacterized protein LOC119650198 [Hermetia illucens]